MFRGELVSRLTLAQLRALGELAATFGLRMEWVDRQLIHAELQPSRYLTRGLRFDPEPASWHQKASGVLKPDAYAVYEAGRWEEHRWLEVDRATESLPTVRRKLLGYLDAVAGSAPGPSGVMPQVLVTVPSARRLDVVRSLLETLPPPADRLISVHCFTDVFGSSGRPPP
jgi:hypothetical protein